MDTNTRLKITLGTILIVGIISVGLSMNNRNTPIVETINTNELLVENQKLKSKNDSLSVELQSQAQRTDFKEKKYKEILFEYELGIDRIKNYHPRAYEDFHRILAHREDYSREAEIENKKRLKNY